MKTIACAILCALVIISSAGTQATSNQSPSAAAPTPQARPGDVDTIEHLVAATYDTISGPAGPRDWQRFRSLFFAGARLIPSRRDQAGKVTANVATVEDYIQR